MPLHRLRDFPLQARTPNEIKLIDKKTALGREIIVAIEYRSADNVDDVRSRNVRSGHFGAAGPADLISED